MTKYEQTENKEKLLLRLKEHNIFHVVLQNSWAYRNTNYYKIISHEWEDLTEVISRAIDIPYNKRQKAVKILKDVEPVKHLQDVWDKEMTVQAQFTGI